ncbi:hypothetical protein PsYK624_087390 [Phanerochaete sordida]|uniref:Uncharacterized protein n=1 Tax=Phanerochaete sordida TaxID=48140 RepID=A0A9P3GF48_9APHY|nr:hypothetical protein PsYK624_087390 [Phanerochaete sordida]
MMAPDVSPYALHSPAVHLTARLAPILSRLGSDCRIASKLGTAPTTRRRRLYWHGEFTSSTSCTTLCSPRSSRSQDHSACRSVSSGGALFRYARFNPYQSQVRPFIRTEASMLPACSAPDVEE